jgi:isoquinoline 1-oxidoreductase beta subunit
MTQPEFSALTPESIARRRFMVGATGLTFGLAIGTWQPIRAQALAATGDAPTGSKGTEMSPWVTIFSDGTISIMSPAVEMGQGSLTSLPLILAEELDADWEKVRIVPAPPNDALYANPAFGMMYTAGSTAVREYYTSLRMFGAQVRRVLLQNAAKQWNVQISELTTEPSVDVHKPTGRRLSYGDIAARAEIPAQAPEIKPEDLKKPAQFRLIGRDVMRVELPQKVNGTAQYSIDVQVPGMVYAAVLRAPVEGSRPEKVIDHDARSVPGVLRIVSLPYGVGVVATAPFAAFKAKNALKVTWSTEGKAWGFDSEKQKAAFSAAARDIGTKGALWESVGDAAEGLKKATTVLEAEYSTDFAYHAQMEPLNSVASVAADGGSAEIWCGTQGQTMAVAAAAKALQISPDRIKLHSMLLGGGFGRRGHRDEEFLVDSVLLSKAVRKPVKVIWTREDDVHNGRFRPMNVDYLRAGLDADGRLVAWHHRVASDLVTAFQDPVRFEKAGRKDFIGMGGAQLKTYDIPNRLSEEIPQDTGARTSALRAIGFGPNKYAIEAFIDEVAAKIGKDPIAFRLDLLKGSPRARKVVETVARIAEWGTKRDGKALGVAYVDYDGSQVATVAEISVDRESGQISVHRIWTAIDPGLAVQPDNVAAQTEGSIIYGLGLALSERITMVDGVVQQSNFYDYRVMRMLDIPELRVEVISTDNHPTGAGQMATPLVAPAIANAFASLTGVRIRQLPMSSDRVLAVLKGSSQKS